MRNYLTILANILWLLLTSPAEAVDTLTVKVERSGPWTTFRAPENEPNVFATGQPRIARDGGLWFPQDEVFIFYDGNVWTRHTQEELMKTGLASSLSNSPDGSLWISGTHQGKAAVTRYLGTGRKGCGRSRSPRPSTALRHVDATVLLRIRE